MIWQPICPFGKRSTPFVTTGTINGQVYIKECLQKRLLPLLRSHNGPTLFWSDLASCHCSKDVLEWYKTNEVNFVPKGLLSPERTGTTANWKVLSHHEASVLETLGSKIGGRYEGFPHGKPEINFSCEKVSWIQKFYFWNLRQLKMFQNQKLKFLFLTSQNQLKN